MPNCFMDSEAMNQNCCMDSEAMNQHWFMDSGAMNQNWFMASGAMHQDALDSSPEEFNVPPPERSDSSSGSDADFFEELLSVVSKRSGSAMIPLKC